MVIFDEKSHLKFKQYDHLNHSRGCYQLPEFDTSLISQLL